MGPQKEAFRIQKNYFIFKILAGFVIYSDLQSIPEFLIFRAKFLDDRLIEYMDQIEFLGKRKENVMIQRTLRHSFVGIMVCFLLVGCEDKKAKEELNKKLNEAKAVGSKAKEELQKVKSSLEELKTARDALKEELTKVTNSLTEARNQITAITKVRDELQLQVNQGKEQISALQGKIDDAKTEGKKAIEEVMKTLTEKTTQLRQASQLAESRAKEIDALKAQLKKLQTTIDELKKNITPAVPPLPDKS